MSDVAAKSTMNDLFRRLRLSLSWVAAQFWATLLLVLAGVAWTRLPDKTAWQVGLTLLVPLVLLAVALLLEAGTMRSLLNQERARAPFVMGAITLLVWAAIVWAAWAILGWCGDQVPVWAGYLNSRASAHARATLFTYEHIQSWLTLLVWIFRWIVVPAKVIPHAMASAQWGWRLPWRKLIRLLLNWRWWLAAVIAALVAVVLPSHFFTGEPHGTVAHQVWAVILKLAGAYLLVVVCWVLLLAWGSVLLDREAEPSEDALDQQLLQRLDAGRVWIAGLAVWTLFAFGSDVLTDHLPDSLKSSPWIIVPLILVLLVSLVFLQVALMRSMIGPDEKRASMVSGTLMPVAWALPGLAALFLSTVPDFPGYFEALCWILVPGLLIPFFASSAQWGAHLPWRRVLRVLPDWRWWLGVVAAVIVGVAIPNLLLPDYGSAVDPNQTDVYLLRKVVSYVLEWSSWVYLMGWYAVLLARTRTGDDALVPAPVRSGPLGKDSVKLPLPEGGDDSGGKA